MSLFEVGGVDPMSKSHVFRPQVSEILDPRAVPSLAGVSLATGIHGISVTLPQQISPTNPQVQAAFAAFDQSYIQAVDTLLTANATNGLVVSSTSRANFVSAIETSLQTLAEQLIASLGTTATTGSTTTAPTLTPSIAATEVVVAITGTGPNSLENQILALSIEQIENQISLTTATSNPSNQGLVPNMVTTAEQIRRTTVVPVLESTGAASTTDLVAASSLSSDASQAAAAVRSAFGAFLNDYFKAVQGTLLAAGSNGQVSPSSNRPAFDTKVSQAIQSLDTTLTASLARYPATSGLGSKLQSTIEGTGPSSLQGQLASLATPESSQGAVVRNFTLASSRTIAQFLAAVNADVAKLIGPSGFGPSGQ